MTIVCIDTEYDARYTDLGVARLACMTYSFGPDHAAIAGPAKAVELWSEWVNDPSVTFLGHSLYNDVAVLAQETYRRAEGRDCVPGQGWAWEQAHRLYDLIYDPRFPGDGLRARCRVIDTEIRQRLTHIRFGPHKADVRLGSIAKALFGEDRSDAKDIPDEAQALLRAAVPYSEWPDDVLARTPYRVLFGMLLERYGEDVSAWPREAVDYALDDARLPWRVYDWQCKRWQSKRIPDDTRQIASSWGLHVLSIPGWKADRERARNIRARYETVIAHCDRTLIDAGILHVPGGVETAKRKRLQSLMYDAFAGSPPITNSRKNAPAPADEAERRDATATDAETVKAAIAKLGGHVVTLADLVNVNLETHPDRAVPLTYAIAQALASSGAPALAAHLLRKEAESAAAKLLKAEGLTAEQAALAPPEYARLLAIADECLPVLIEAGLVEVSHPRTIKKRVVADMVYTILGDDAPLSKKKAEEIPDPTPEQRREFCSTAAKTVRGAIIVTGGKLRLPADAVAMAEGSEADFDRWLAESKQPALNAYAVRSKASKIISSFLDYLDTDRRIRTTYQTLVDTGRTSSRRPNVQQLPRDYDKPSHLHVRGCLVPDPGWAFLVADYSQLELCSLAHVLTNLVRHYARGPNKELAEQLLRTTISPTYESTLARAINDDRDCHLLMAATLLGMSYAECVEIYERAEAKKKAKQPLTTIEQSVIDHRQLAKACNFGFPGGLGARKFIDYAAGYGVTIDLGTAKHARKAYVQTWIEMRLYFHHIDQMCKENGNRLTTLRQLRSKRLRGDCNYTQAANGYFQALAADGAKEALRRIIRAAYRDASSPLYGTRPSGFVHDEFLVNCLIEQAPAALPALEREMVEGMQLWIPDVKIKAPGKILTERWGK
jgi:hypothetical protein